MLQFYWYHWNIRRFYDKVIWGSSFSRLRTFYWTSLSLLLVLPPVAGWCSNSGQLWLRDLSYCRLFDPIIKIVNTVTSLSAAQLVISQLGVLTTSPVHPHTGLENWEEFSEFCLDISKQLNWTMSTPWHPPSSIGSAQFNYEATVQGQVQSKPFNLCTVSVSTILVCSKSYIQHIYLFSSPHSIITNLITSDCDPEWCDTMINTSSICRCRCTEVG